MFLWGDGVLQTPDPDKRLHLCVVFSVHPADGPGLAWAQSVSASCFLLSLPPRPRPLFPRFFFPPSPPSLSCSSSTHSPTGTPGRALLGQNKVRCLDLQLRSLVAQLRLPLPLLVGHVQRPSGHGHSPRKDPLLLGHWLPLKQGLGVPGLGVLGNPGPVFSGETPPTPSPLAAPAMVQLRGRFLGGGEWGQQRATSAEAERPRQGSGLWSVGSSGVGAQRLILAAWSGAWVGRVRSREPGGLWGGQVGSGVVRMPRTTRSGWGC